MGDEIVATGRSAPFTTRIRGIYRPAPIVRGREAKRPVLESVTTVEAAAGVYVSAPGIENAMPGGLLKVVRTASEREAAEADLAQESHPVADLAESGVALAADTLGGLEALAFESPAGVDPDPPGRCRAGRTADGAEGRRAQGSHAPSRPGVQRPGTLPTPSPKGPKLPCASSGAK